MQQTDGQEAAKSFTNHGNRVWVTKLDSNDLPVLDQISRIFGEEALRQLGLYWLPENFKLSVCVPVYNEKGTIHEILRQIRAVNIPKEIILVDDCSRDGTRDILKQMPPADDLKIYFHDVNQGKGAALRTAFQKATGDIVIIQDADLEYDPQEYPKLIQPILDGRADVVYGSRFKGDVVRIHLFWHRIANGVLTLMSNFFTNLNLTDMETCYKVFKREVIQGIDLKQNRFGFEPEVTAKIARRRCRIYEIPISYSGRDYSEGKKIGIKDAFNAFWCVVRYWLAD